MHRVKVVYRSLLVGIYIIQNGIIVFGSFTKSIVSVKRKKI